MEQADLSPVKAKNIQPAPLTTQQHNHTIQPTRRNMAREKLRIFLYYAAIWVPAIAVGILGSLYVQVLIY